MDDDDVERNHALWMFLHSYAARAHVRVDIRMKSTRMKFTYAPRARARARLDARVTNQSHHRRRDPPTAVVVNDTRRTPAANSES
mmetsp:Transcript_8450/g.31434  ORF Transcript_8450/g.31434 Transcript_8450/m.31434 type:complete len:85 (-) Transcript_8450:297-551(-)